MTPRAWIGFATMSALWGIPYLFIKIAIDHGLSPAFIAWSRVVLAAAVLCALAARAGLLASLKGRAKGLGALAGVGISIPVPPIAPRGRDIHPPLTAGI